MKHYYVLIGNFGSGKSEIALNLAIEAAKTKKTVLVDLDIVNPYFKSAERKQDLLKAGVDMIHSIYALKGVDVPALPPEVYAAFAGGHEVVIFDVGGDPVGATALGRYKPNFLQIPEEALEVLYVVNPRRPMAATPELVLEMMEKIRYRSRLDMTGLVNNGNLSGDSSAEDLLMGYQVLEEVAKETGVPVLYTVGEKKPLNDFLSLAKERGLDKKYIGKPMEITTYMHRDWERFTEQGV